MRGRETYSPCASLGFEIGQKILRIMRAGIFRDRQWHGDCNGKNWRRSSSPGRCLHHPLDGANTAASSSEGAGQVRGTAVRRR